MALADTANAVGTDIAQSLNALTRGEDVSVQAWQLICTKLAAWIATNAVATIPAGAINTVGTAASQSGPPTDVELVVT